MLLLLLPGHCASRNIHPENSDLVRISNSNVFMVIIHPINAARLSESTNSFLRRNVLSHSKEMITYMFF